MPLLESFNLIMNYLPVFALVLFRVAGLFALAPVFSSVAIPMQARVFLAVAISFVLFPLVPPLTYQPDSLLTLTYGVATEMLIGMTMGFMVSLVFVGIQIGAEMIGQQMGLSLANVFDPTTQDQNNVLAQFFIMVTTLIYLFINGHLFLIGALLKTFRQIPLLQGGFLFVGPENRGVISDVLWQVCDILKAAFALGVRIAGPALIAVFLSTLALGFISRTMPQLNILAAGFPVRIILSLIILIGSITMVGLIFEQYIIQVFDTIYQLFL